MEKILDKPDLILEENERVIANILHDIKSPLYSIKIALQNNLKTELDNDIFETTINVISYIENFLLNYNFKTGKYTGNPEICDIRQIIENKIKNYKYLFLNKNIHIDIIDEINKEYKAKSIKAFLSSIIGNIISNIAYHASNNKNAIIKLEHLKKHIVVHFQNNYDEKSENFSLGLDFSKRLSQIIKAELKFNKTNRNVSVSLKIPNLEN